MKQTDKNFFDAIPQIGTKELNNLAKEMVSGKPKQETLEEATERLYPNKSTKGWIDQYSAIQRIHFIEGAKWQAERMYSEEEVITILDSYNKYLKGVTKEQSVEEWFEQFKKK